MVKKTARSKSCGRQPDQGQQIADINLSVAHLGSFSGSTPGRAKLPPQQKHDADTDVSVSSPRNVNDDTPQGHANNTFSNEISNDKRDISSNTNQPSERIGRELRSRQQKGNNRGNSPVDSREHNSENVPPTDSALPPAKPEDPWYPAFQELKEIRKSMVTIDNFERSTKIHSQQLAGVIQRTSKLESDLGDATNKVKDLGEELTSLRTIVNKQEETINSLTKANEEYANSLKSVKEELAKTTEQTQADMNNRLQEQKDQAENFQEQNKILKQDVMKELEGKFGEVSPGKMKDLEGKVEEMSKEIKHTKSELKGEIAQVADEAKYDSLKSQARSNKFNLVITGLQEDTNKTHLASAKDFFSSTLKIKGLQLDVAYRLGAAPPDDSSYARPLVARFSSIAHRDRAWRSRSRNRNNG